MSATSAASVFSGVSAPTATAAVHAARGLLGFCGLGVQAARQALHVATIALSTATALNALFGWVEDPRAKLLLAGVYFPVTASSLVVSAVCNPPGEVTDVTISLVCTTLLLAVAAGSLWKEVKAFLEARKEKAFRAPAAISLRPVDDLPAATGNAVHMNSLVARRTYPSESDEV